MVMFHSFLYVYQRVHLSSVFITHQSESPHVDFRSIPGRMVHFRSGPWLKVGSTAAPEALEVDPKPSQKQKQSSAGQGVPWP